MKGRQLLVSTWQTHTYKKKKKDLALPKCKGPNTIIHGETNISFGFEILEPTSDITLCISRDIQTGKGMNLDPLSGPTHGDHEWTTQGLPRHHGQPLLGCMTGHLRWRGGPWMVPSQSPWDFPSPDPDSQGNTKSSLLFKCTRFCTQ